jgi:ferric-dicitrate binding protein FerR (iron transport regulator)
MDKEKIIAYITGQITDPKEKSEVWHWINQDHINKQLFVQLKNVYALSRKSSSITDADAEYLKWQGKTRIRTRKLIQEFIKYAAIIFFTIGLTWVVQENYTNLQLAETGQMNEVICPAGQISELVLSDSTKVWLNAGSKISYPSNFSSQQRTVHLTGEAFFEVKKDQKNPFLVHTKTMDIKVLGTSFNVDAYEGSQFKTTLVEGKVELQDKSGDKIAEMSPGQSARYDTNSRKIILSEVDTRFYSSWKEGKMAFFNEPLEVIAGKLERWYNVKITFASEDIKTFRYSGTFLKYKPLEQILNIIKISSTIDYSIKVNPEDKDEIILKKLTNDETSHES